MAIRKVTHLTEILPGQYICVESMLRDHIARPPYRVLRRSGKRVYFADRHGDEQYCPISSIVALCDTRQEGEAFFAISQAQYDELDAVRARFKAQAEAMFA